MQIKTVLHEALLPLACRIEHVGSTAVAGLAAKPIIDIDIIYPAAAFFEPFIPALSAIGYHHHGDQGIAGRQVFKRSGRINHSVLDGIRHHLYVCCEGNAALERHLLFRDALRSNEAARLEYEIMKYKLAEEAEQHQKIYARLKEVMVNPFIDRLTGLGGKGTTAQAGDL
jgi:GrpB-like predicted nucleotidyltransferase (UPF0157 family)